MKKKKIDKGILYSFNIMTEHASYIFSAYSTILSLSEEEILQTGYQITNGSPIPSFDENLLIELCKDAQKLFKNEENIINLEGDIIVVGDIHGSLHDLLRILKYIQSSKCKVLFLGDYVDRGFFSLECITLLFAFKVMYPDNYFLIRGNHEFDSMCSCYGFKKELLNYHNPKKAIKLVSNGNRPGMILDKVDYNFTDGEKEDNKSHHISKEMLCDAYFSNHVYMYCHKYTEKLYNAFINAFSYLPICAIVNQTSLCIHGGISPKLEKLDKINRRIQRPITDFDQNPLLSDLIWGDPSHEQMNQSSTQLYYDNPRGRGNLFSGIALSNFLRSNNLKRIIRAHQCVLNGTEQKFNEKCITVFSASSYNCQMGNSSGILKIVQKGDKVEPVTFEPLSRLKKSDANYYKVQAFETETTKPMFNVINGNIRSSYSMAPDAVLQLDLDDMQLKLQENKLQSFYLGKEDSSRLKRSIMLSKKSKTTSILNCKKLTYDFSFNTGVHHKKSMRSKSFRFPKPPLVDDFDITKCDNSNEQNAMSEIESPFVIHPSTDIVRVQPFASQPMSCIIQKPSFPQNSIQKLQQKVHF